MQSLLAVSRRKFLGLLSAAGLFRATATVAADASATATRPAPATSGLELKPVLDLAHRVVPWMDGKLILIRIPQERGDDVFDLRTEGGKLVIRASDPSSAAMGLNYYLRYSCHRSMSLVGNNLAPVEVLPELARPVHRTSPFKYRYYPELLHFQLLVRVCGLARVGTRTRLDGAEWHQSGAGGEWNRSGLGEHAAPLWIQRCRDPAIHFRTGVHRMVAYGKSGRLGRASDAAND